MLYFIYLDDDGTGVPSGMQTFSNKHPFTCLCMHTQTQNTAVECICWNDTALISISLPLVPLLFALGIAVGTVPHHGHKQRKWQRKKKKKHHGKEMLGMHASTVTGDDFAYCGKRETPCTTVAFIHARHKDQQLRKLSFVHLWREKKKQGTLPLQWGGSSGSTCKKKRKKKKFFLNNKHSVDTVVDIESVIKWAICLFTGNRPRQRCIIKSPKYKHNKHTPWPLQPRILRRQEAVRS